MPRAVLAQLHLQAVGEKRQQVVGLMQIGMRLHQHGAGQLLGLLRHQYFELHRQLDIGRAQLQNLLVQRMQQRDSVR